jgi:hypothetical protein
LENAILKYEDNINSKAEIDWFGWKVLEKIGYLKK